MLLLNPLIVIVPVTIVGMALLGYARLLQQRRQTEQLKNQPVPVISSKRSGDRIKPGR